MIGLGGRRDRSRHDQLRQLVGQYRQETDANKRPPQHQKDKRDGTQQGTYQGQIRPDESNQRDGIPRLPPGGRDATEIGPNEKQRRHDGVSFQRPPFVVGKRELVKEGGDRELLEGLVGFVISIIGGRRIGNGVVGMAIFRPAAGVLTWTTGPTSHAHGLRVSCQASQSIIQGSKAATAQHAAGTNANGIFLETNTCCVEIKPWSGALCF